MDHPTDRLPTLDGWRGIAILLVILAHSLPASDNWYAGLGIIGVRLFFGISGLVVCYTLAKEKDRTGRIRLGQFYGRRGFRLLPAALMFLTTVSLLGWLGIIPVTRAEIIASLALIRNYIISADWHYTAHLWSLMVEEHFYLLAPVVLAFCSRRVALVVFPLLALVVAVWRGLDARYHWLGLSFTIWRTDLCLDYLLWGAWFGIQLASGRERLAWLGHALPRWGLTAALVALVMWPIPVVGFWFALLAPALLVATVQAPDSLLGRILCWRPLAWIGLVSYSLYLWQELFLVPLASVAMQTVPPFDRLQSWPLAIPFLFAVATAAYYGIEKPLRRRGYRWLNRAARVRQHELVLGGDNRDQPQAARVDELCAGSQQ